MVPFDEEATRTVIGRTLSHFKIIERLGEGGMGAVYLAEDTRLKRQVALKVLPGHLANDADRLARFQREAETLAALNHPNIVAIYSVESDAGVRFLIMERVLGRTLADLVPQGGFSAEAFFELAVPIADAMAAAHAKGIIHRDLKPANVMATDDGVAKVLDLGLAKLGDGGDEIDGDAPTRTASPTALGVIMGTIGYMSPEQAEGRPVGPPSDVFSLGALFYEMLAGENPFRRDSTASSLAAILHHRPEPIRRLRHGLPRDLQPILDRCLAKDPEQRYPSAAELHTDLLGSRERFRRRHSGLRAILRRPIVAVPIATLLLAAIGPSLWYWRGAAGRRWAREVALPEIARLAGERLGDTSAAYRLALEAEKHIPSDPRLQELIARCSLDVSVSSEPPGAEIFIKDYGSPTEPWTPIGVTPIDSVRLPIGVMRWRFEKPGYETVLAVASTWAVGGGDLLRPNHVSRVLDPVGSAPAGMVRVAGFESAGETLPDFFIDRFEVTNRQFKEFVDAGGYTDPELWKHSFSEGGTDLSWDEAMSRFVDQTDRPGPATWTAGAYPRDQANHPVAGVSWYEAAAFAEFVGKALPTLYHWGRARGEGEMVIDVPQLGGYAIFAPFSNFARDGPVEVGRLGGPTAFGAFDMAGNVREWCLNSTSAGALVRGGAWSDATYMFGEPSQLPRMDRSPQNGFRCALYPDPGKLPEAVLAPIDPVAKRRVQDETPVSDEIFDVFRERFEYDRVDLDARLESRSEDNEWWIRETVSYAAAYGGERILGHLFLPRNARPPYQTVVYFPGSGSIVQRSSAEIDTYWEMPIFVSYLIENGRAVLYPVYKGTFERQDPSFIGLHEGDDSHSYTEFLIQQVKDLRRSVDYLETRDDIDSERLAYYGLSWGALVAPIALAVEDRFRTSVLLAGGVAVRVNGRDISFRPETDPVNYLPRVRLPTLMINGRYDMLLPLEQSIRPMYDLLGTQPEQKRLLLYDTDHIPPRNEFIKETLAWLDSYLGPVER